MHNTTAAEVVVRILLLVNAVFLWWYHGQSMHAKEHSCWLAVGIAVLQMLLMSDWGVRICRGRRLQVSHWW